MQCTAVPCSVIKCNKVNCTRLGNLIMIEDFGLQQDQQKFVMQYVVQCTLFNDLTALHPGIHDFFLCLIDVLLAYTYWIFSMSVHLQYLTYKNPKGFTSSMFSCHRSFSSPFFCLPSFCLSRVSHCP